MSSLIDRLGKLLATTLTRGFARTRLGTRRLFCDRPIASFVTKCRTFGLFAARAGLWRRASCIDPFVTERFALFIIAAATMLRARAGRRLHFMSEGLALRGPTYATCRRFRARSLAPLM